MPSASLWVTRTKYAPGLNVLSDLAVIRHCRGDGPVSIPQATVCPPVKSLVVLYSTSVLPSSLASPVKIVVKVSCLHELGSTALDSTVVPSWAPAWVVSVTSCAAARLASFSASSRPTTRKKYGVLGERPDTVVDEVAELESAPSLPELQTRSAVVTGVDVE